VVEIVSNLSINPPGSTPTCGEPTQLKYVEDLFEDNNARKNDRVNYFSKDI